MALCLRVSLSKKSTSGIHKAVNDIYAATKWVAEHGEEIQCLDAGARKAWRTPCILMIPDILSKYALMRVTETIRP